jgi:hypothetical protein
MVQNVWLVLQAIPSPNQNRWHRYRRFFNRESCKESRVLPHVLHRPTIDRLGKAELPKEGSATFLCYAFFLGTKRSRARKNFYAAGVEWSGESHVTWVGLCDGLTGSDWGVDMTWCFCLAKLSLGLWHTGVQTRPKAYGSSIFFTKISKIELNI